MNSTGETAAPSFRKEGRRRASKHITSTTHTPSLLRRRSNFFILPPSHYSEADKSVCYRAARTRFRSAGQRNGRKGKGPRRHIRSSLYEERNRRREQVTARRTPVASQLILLTSNMSFAVAHQRRHSSRRQQRMPRVVMSSGAIVACMVAVMTMQLSFFAAADSTASSNGTATAPTGCEVIKTNCSGSVLLDVTFSCDSAFEFQDFEFLGSRIRACVQ